MRRAKTSSRVRRLRQDLAIMVRGEPVSTRCTMSLLRLAVEELAVEDVRRAEAVQDLRVKEVGRVVRGNGLRVPTTVKCRQQHLRGGDEESLSMLLFRSLLLRNLLLLVED